MKTFVLALAFLLGAVGLSAQTTSVSGSVTDAGGQNWSYGSYYLSFNPNPQNASSQYFLAGVPLNVSQQIPGSLSSTGTFSGASVPDNSKITPAGSTWKLTVCPAATTPCYTTTQTIQGATMTLTPIPPAIVLNLVNPPAGAAAYSDSEISGARPGSFYFNLGDDTIHICNVIGFPPCTWQSLSGGNAPGAPNFSVQFNNTGSLGGDSQFTYTPSTHTLNLANLSDTNITSTGTITSSGNIVAPNVNNVIAVDGVKYTTVQAALADPQCATAGLGCTIDMRGNSSSTALALGALDPGTVAPVTLMLGPYTYTTSGVTLRNYFHIIGAARGSTVLQSTSTTAPIFSLGGTTAVYSNHVQDLIVYCGAGNTTQLAFNIIAQVNGGGLNYSDWKDVTVGGDGVHECGGESFLFDGSAGGSPPAINQFLTFINVQAFRKLNGSPAFHVRGVGGQMYILGASQFDGNATRDTLPNVVIEDSAFAGFTAAYSIAFYGTTFQRGGTAIKLRGSTDVSIDNGHFENVTGIIDAAIGQNYGNKGTQILHSYCATACAQNSGSGFLTKTDANSQLAVDYLSLYGTPDNYWTGSSIVGLEHQGLTNFSNGLNYPSPNSSFRIPVGIDCDSPAYKCASTAVTNVTAGTYAPVTVTWTTPFPDGSYVPVCNVYDPTSPTNAAGLRFERLQGSTSLSPSGLTAVVFNASGGTLSGVLLCTAVHI